MSEDRKATYVTSDDERFLFKNANNILNLIHKFDFEFKQFQNKLTNF